MYLISEAGDITQEVIYSKYKPVIEYYCKMYMKIAVKKGLDYSDLYQEGLIGLNSAIDNYKEQKNIKFSTFAFICIKRKIISAVRLACSKKHSVLNDSYSLDYQTDEDNYDFSNSVYISKNGTEDLLVSEENIELYNKLINERFTNLEKQVYELRLNGFSNDEISNTINRSYKSVESVLFRIRIKLKKILNEID